MATPQHSPAVIPPVPPKVMAIKKVLEATFDRIAEVCRKHISPEDLYRIAMATIYRTPKLQDCDPWSIANALMQAGACGLHVDGDEAYLIPYWNSKSKSTEAQFRPSYKGRIKVVIDSGAALSIDAHVVYSNDQFDYSYGVEPNIYHKPALRDRGEPIAVYCTGKNATGQAFLDIMTACRDCLKPCPKCKGKGKDWSSGKSSDCQECKGSCSSTEPLCDVERRRNVSQSPHDGPWVDWWDEQACKTILIHACKRLRGNPRVEKLIRLDTEAEQGKVELPTELEMPKRSMPKRLSETRQTASAAEMQSEKQTTTQSAEEPKAPDQSKFSPPPGWDPLAGRVTELCGSLNKPDTVAEHLKLAMAIATPEGQVAALEASVKALEAEYEHKAQEAEQQFALKSETKGKR